MKKFLSFFLFALSFAAAVPAFAQPDDYGSPHPPPQQVDQEKQGGWFLGSDQGVLFFVGTGDDFMGPQYYGSIFGGYNIDGWIAPMLLRRIYRQQLRNLEQYAANSLSGTAPGHRQRGE